MDLPAWRAWGFGFLPHPCSCSLEPTRAFRTKVNSETPTSGFFLVRGWLNSFFLSCLCPAQPVFAVFSGNAVLVHSQLIGPNWIVVF